MEVIKSFQKEKITKRIQLDESDMEILRMLQRDGKLTHKEIAHKLGLTITPVYERIKRLERSGLIKSYVALLDRSLLGHHLMAYCNVSLKEHAQHYIVQFEEEVLNLEEVQECYHLAGMYDYLLKVVVPSVEAYQSFIVKKLASLENIGKVESAFVMNEIKHTTALHI